VTDALSRLSVALSDRYRIERELGQGGMATVYLAHDIKHDRDVAVKVLHPDLGAALGGERFLTEIRTTAKLQHPHILPLLDSGEADGLLYYVMPYVTGETLRARLVRERQLPISDAVLIAREVADALGSAHALGIIHRDIKPENILLQGGHALVADFGIALAVQTAGGQRMTQTGLSLGTPQYMSPEQAMGERTIDARTDIYALGVVTYEMLAGDPPFSGSSVQAIVAKVMTERPSPITTVRDTVPAGVEYAVLRALAKLPADRWATAAEFATALRSDAPAGTTQHAAARKSRDSWSRLTVVLGASTLVLLGVTAWALTRGAPAASGAQRMFDAALPDSALMSSAPAAATGYGTPTVNLSVSPMGDFVVYPVRRGDSTMLWYRSLVDASAHPIEGTAGGTTPRISPDGMRLAFAASGRILMVPIQGGPPRRLSPGESAVGTLDWVSPARLVATTDDGSILHWLDPEGGVTDEKVRLAARCVLARWIASDGRLLCTRGFGELRNLKSGASTTIRGRNADGSPGPIVFGDAFRIVDDRYLVYLAVDGDLRAAPYDKRTGLLGRSVSLVSGIKIDATGAAQMDLTPNGMLGFVPGMGSADVQMVVLRPGSEPKRVPIERAHFQRFDVTRDGHRMAAVVLTSEGQELRIYDLRTGQRQTWLRAEYIGGPFWDKSGDRLLVRIRNATGAAILLGSPSAATRPDTIFSAADQILVPEVTDYPDDGIVLARSINLPSAVTRIDLTRRPLHFDTLVTDAGFAAISPDRKHMVWQSLASAQLNLTSYPPGPQQQLIAVGGVEPLWLSSTDVLYRTGVTWSIADLNPSTGQLAGPPTRWGFDPRFLDTPGWSNRVSWDGGIVYVQSPDVSDARFLRFIPDFITRMKAAVDKANR
jgi:eukaryotic-like serine/threonine-protein kinase